jgi:YegS/Rv2252/BmrU family lipid kinase
LDSTSVPPGHDEPLVVIFNKRALGARALRHSGMDQALHERGLPHEIIDTTSPEDSREQAEKAARAGRIVVAAGGDGTALDVANGVLAAAHPEAAMAHFPLGTGNDLARSLGRVGHGLERALDALVEKRVIGIDVGRINGGEYYVNALGIGFDAEVVRRRRQQRLNLPTYFPDAVLTVFGYEPQSYRVDWATGAWEGPALMLAAMNGIFEGGGVRLAPRAEMEDGLFELYWIDPISLPKFARYVWAVRWGRHDKLPMVRYARTERLTVESESPIRYHLDGEYRELSAGTTLEIVVHHELLRMVV